MGKGRIYFLTFAFTMLASGLLRLLVLGRGPSAARYLAAIFGSFLVIMLEAVILAVWEEKPWQAPLFLVLTATSGALLFYRMELRAGYVPLATQIVMVVALTVWMLANIGCTLRQRLRAMD